MNDGQKASVLLVEDEPEARDALARALTRAGYDVIVASEVAEALAAVEARGKRPPRCAVLDIILGGDERGGLRLLEDLRRRWPHLPVALITAFADVDKLKTALNLGASHLIEKPFRAVELLAVLERLLTTPSEPSALVAAAFARAGLTPREEEVARLALKGLPSPEIAAVLGMSDKTVRQHLSRVYEKHGVSSRGELFHLLFPI